MRRILVHIASTLVLSTVVTVSLPQMSSADGADRNTAGAAVAARLSVGASHACTVADSNVYCWGSNTYGQLGQHPTNVLSANVPMRVQGLTDPIAVAAGTDHTCAVVTGGDVYCWGRDNYANGKTSGGLTHQPALVTGISGATAITAGDAHTCALVAGGAVSCWGQNPSFQLGRNSSNTVTPTDVTGLTGAVSVSAGDAHTCVALSDGSVKCWGNNMMGQLGNGGTTSNFTPVTVQLAVGGSLTGAVSVSAGHWHSCAVTSTKGAYCWGANTQGELGAQNPPATAGTNSSAHPVRSARASGTDANDVIGISAGYDYTCILRETGAVACFGYNDLGQVGIGTSGSSSSQGPDTVGTVTGASVVTTGKNTTCAMDDSRIWCWGAGNNGQIGNSTNTSATSPAAVTGFRQQTISFAAPADTSVASGTVQVSATSSSGGPVSFSSQTTSVCTVSGATVTLLAPGTCTVRASAAAYRTFTESENVDRSFTVTGTKPTARTASASSISSGKANLNGVVNANGLTTTVSFVWGQKPDLSDGTTVEARAASGLSDTDVSATVTSLSEAVRYYYRIDASNPMGSVQGSIVSFTTSRPVGISVNDAAEFTNKKAVTIFATGPSGATQVIISNDGGFKSSQTFSLTDGYAELSWNLVASRDERLPKTVYARFVQRFGSQSSNYSDDIILDTTAPVMNSASGSSTSAGSGNVAVAAVRAPARGGVKLTVRAKDANSGIGKVQVKGSAGGRAVDVATGSPKASSRTVKVNTTKKKLWVRVVDRAGNVSKWVTVTVK